LLYGRRENHFLVDGLRGCVPIYSLDPQKYKSYRVSTSVTVFCAVVSHHCYCEPARCHPAPPPCHPERSEGSPWTLTHPATTILKPPPCHPERVSRSPEERRGRISCGLIGNHQGF